MMGDSFSSDDVAVAKQAAEGVYFSNLYANDTKTLAKKYKTKFGQAPSQNVFVSFGYDGVKTLFAGIQKAKNNGTKTADEIRQLNILGTDTEINFSGKQYSEKQERLYRVQNKQFVEIQ
jgi:ABC-type branched-subunit amino acid transport system substrate-binding protein